MARTSSGPPPLDTTTSARFRRMPRAGTTPEVALRRELHRRGLRFRVDECRLPGRPDLAFTRAKVAVFVDGCFWHRCAEHGTLPRHNRDWWRAKLDRNVARDRRKDAALDGLGWTVLHVWEHEPVESAAERVVTAWRRGLTDGSAGSRHGRTTPAGPGSG